MSDAEEIEECRRQYAKPGMTAGEFAPYLPEHLRQPYWRQKLDEYFARELGPNEEPTRDK